MIEDQFLSSCKLADPPLALRELGWFTPTKDVASSMGAGGVTDSIGEKEEIKEVE